MFIRFLLKNYNKNFLVFLLYFTTTNYCNSSDQIEVIKIFPPKCTILKDSKTLLCPRIMEIEIRLNNNKKNQLISCILLSEEEEILAFGENILSYPGGRIYLTIREMRRKINEMKLIASSKCTLIKN
tara:strand:- start:11977 stop:12357 length:381 start_codon:yes stop_codon:yes gene_type:complete